MTVTKVPALIDATPELVAKLLAEMTDDDQAMVFALVAKHMATWTDPDAGRWQMMRVGVHLAECTCAIEGRAIISTIYESMTDAIATMDAIACTRPR